MTMTDLAANPTAPAPPAFTCPQLAALAGLRHGFFGRTGGISTGVYHSLNTGLGSDDNTDHVAENRARVAAAMGLADINRLVTLYQVHSPEVVTVAHPIALDARPKADAMVTATPGLGLGILTADCAPVLFADPSAGVIGAAHAGWKGAFTGVLEATVDAMVGLGAKPSGITASIGPMISQAAYEVGPEYVARLVAAEADNARFFQSGGGDRSRFDLPGYVGARLRRAGVGAVHHIPACTCTDEMRLFSYRRASQRGDADYGRNISVITLVQ